MIGVALHLMALVPAAVAARATRFGLSLLCRAPQGSEIEQLAAECDVLREERNEARIEHAAAVEVCDELKKLLAAAREERDDAQTLAHEAKADAAQLRAQLAALRALVLSLKTTWTAHMTPGTLVHGWAWKEVLRTVSDLLAAVPAAPEAPRG